ncbi:TfuA domain-containing protein [Streptomyces malaysiensis]|uniref:TfuA domain-containing protein n=1 Tax=Streptomyces malaysiensis subsp. samsunensis TaxID=459658 RepID=A0A9X2MAJ2_STRMQ|nr:TfuA domain-containing protein [Streptomyces samsunensis]MCQ8836179.1 TfuA domain-containing protein [Streptomyces samsunensis]
MGRGVRVVGAASIGALRAAELAPFGMTGIGSIFDAYARGEIDGDDEVAVGQAPDGAWDALTWPVVNVRYVLELAQVAGVLDAERAAGLLVALRAVYYPQRTTAAVRAVCRRQGETEFAGWLAERRASDRHFGDLKRADALAAVRAALEGLAPQSADQPSASAVWETTHFRRWSNAAVRARVDGLELSTEDRVVYQQVFNPAFGQTWAAYLEHRSRHPAHGPGLPLTARLAQVTGGDLPAHRVFHPAVDLRDEATVTLLLANETPRDRHTVARYAEALALARRTRPGFSVEAVRDDLTRRVLLELWQCLPERFDAETSARGLVSGARAVEAAKRLIPGVLAEKSERTEAASGAR